MTRRRRSSPPRPRASIRELKKVLSGQAIVNLQKLVTSVPISDYVVDYVTRLVRAPGRRSSSATVHQGSRGLGAGHAPVKI